MQLENKSAICAISQILSVIGADSTCETVEGMPDMTAAQPGQKYIILSGCYFAPNSNNNWNQMFLS